MIIFFKSLEQKIIQIIYTAFENSIGIRNLDNFGDNPGNLDMYYFEPDNPNSRMPLVVVMHGCSQDAADIAELTEWNDLANKYGFYVK
jgi:poly(3-hydroxybutyrate) depolymerase